MTIQTIRFLHLLITVSFLGFQIAGYYYLLTSLQQSSVALVRYTIKNTLIIDAFSSVFIVGIFFSCAAMVRLGDRFSFATPWIVAACFFLSAVSFFWLCNVIIKIINLRAINKSSYNTFRYKRWLYGNYIVTIIVLIMIMRDAITHSTLF